MASCCGQVWRFQYNVNHMFPLFYRQNHFHKINVYIFHRTKDAELVIRWVYKTYLFVSQNTTPFFNISRDLYHKIQIRKTPKEGSNDEWEAIRTRVEVRAWGWKRCKNKNSKGVSYWVRKDVWEWRWRLILFHWFHSVKEIGTDEKYGMGHLFDKRILLFTLIQVLSGLQIIFPTFTFLYIMTFSDASMASSSSWILWTFLWLFLNGGGLLRQFGNMYKVNRCLARYSPRHNHQPTHQQGIKWAGKAWPKMTLFASFIGRALDQMFQKCQYLA